MSDPGMDLPPDRNSFSGSLGRIVGRFFWILIPVALIALILWAIR